LFVLDQLKFRGGLAIVQRAYKYSLEAASKSSLVAAFYEMYWHLWFDTTKPCGIEYFHNVNKKEPLCTENRYWAPGKEKEANVDAALVYKNTLYAFQYTFMLQKRKGFNDVSFASNFVAPLLVGMQGVDRVVVLFVSPHAKLKTPNLESRTKLEWNGTVSHKVSSKVIAIKFISVYADVLLGKEPEFHFLDTTNNMIFTNLIETFGRAQCHIL
jgi:hypothetical protein